MKEGSLTQQLASISSSFTDIPSDRRYAELWYGAHTNGESRVRSENPNEHLSLSALLKEFPQEILGSRIAECYNNTLPFLFKVLSVDTALSIQAHPDEVLAPVLNTLSPEDYPDKLPKPEIGVAISEVQLLYGFRPLQEIIHWMHRVPELQEIIGQEITQKVFQGINREDEALKKIYRSVMTVDQDFLQRQSQLLFDRLATAHSLLPEEEHVLRLQKNFPDGDVGLFNLFLLNFVRIPPGKSIYIGPNIPHSYLHNELVECMAPSDNVVRAGFTKKFRDVETLLDMLEYDVHKPKILEAIPSELPHYFEYPSPNLSFFRLGTFDTRPFTVTVPTQQQVELLICIEGEAKLHCHGHEECLRPGEAALIPAIVESYSISQRNEGRIFRVTA
ncbi:MAG: mannose-6-phosphate isomerase, class I, partial [Bdellovibrionales bacterium]|nr:mannose-6-phosphate isomerase, class I [Bdellovibrionales bacterium]